MAAVRAGLSFLNDLDAASIPVAQQAECLRELARAPSDRRPSVGWVISLNADGTAAATSPDGTRILPSHSPPRQAA